MALNENEISGKSRLITFLLFFLGVHRFYVGKIVSGIFYIFTAGGFGIWALIDFIKILSGSFKDQFGKFINNWKADKKQLIIVICILGFVFFLGIIIGQSGHDAKETSVTDNSNTNKKIEEVKTYKIMELITTDDLEVTVTNFMAKKSVGGEYFSEAASEGGILICIQYKYKNISKKPISSKPYFKLVDFEGTEYSTDSGKSGYYATEVDIDEKFLSDLNPGITSKGADVFEISKESWAKPGWKLNMSCGWKSYEISLK